MPNNQELIDILLDSTQKYTASRIENNKDREVYNRTFNLLFYEITDDVKKSITNVISMDFEPEEFPYYFIGGPEKYISLARGQVVDVLNSINKRFIIGGGSDYNVFTKN
jgi:predicted ATP-grasp superfamily ATP-dependent carboligase